MKEIADDLPKRSSDGVSFVRVQNDWRSTDDQPSAKRMSQPSHEDHLTVLEIAVYWNGYMLFLDGSHKPTRLYARTLDANAFASALF